MQKDKSVQKVGTGFPGWIPNAKERLPLRKRPGTSGSMWARRSANFPNSASSAGASNFNVTGGVVGSVIVTVSRSSSGSAIPHLAEVQFVIRDLFG
jgi:hypothetical protein